MLDATTHPVKLLGYLYTLEGSLMGAQSLIKDISTQFSLSQNQATMYLNSYGSEIESYWDSFKTILVAEVLPEEYDTVIDGANEAFESLIKLYQTLFPLEKENFATHITVLNPEAGDISVPPEANVIAAAIEASRECWYFFPYYEYRYGERGYRFGLSDVTWLATLCEMEQSYVNTQVEWLAKVLANIGMPSVMLRHQLGILHKRLSNEGVVESVKILNAAHYLKEKNFMVLEEKTAKELEREFEKGYMEDFSRKLRNSGVLIISSVIDEYLGFTEHSTAFASWISDEKRFSKEWSKSVHELIAKTREAIKSQDAVSHTKNKETSSSSSKNLNSPEISKETMNEYQENREDLLFEFHQCLNHNEKAQDLRANVGYDILYEFHSLQLGTLVILLELKDFDKIKETFSNDYRTYFNHGLAYQYFIESNHSWKCAVKSIFNGKSREELLALYSWLEVQHEEFIALSQTNQNNEVDISKEQKELVEYLIQGKYENILQLSLETMNKGMTISTLFITLFHPALVYIGHLWENNIITSSQEHICTSTITRLLTELYQNNSSAKANYGNAIVMTAENEKHLIGATVVANALEQDGWDIQQIGAEFSIEETIELLKVSRAIFLAISLVAPFHLGDIQKLVKKITEDESLKDLKIMAGGRVFDTMIEVKEMFDKKVYHIKDANEAVIKAREWV